MNYGEDDDQTVLTAYHEAGHAVVGYALGGSVRSVQLGGEADDVLPERFGDCRIEWPATRSEVANCDWHREREILTILAGPVAEMIFSGQPYHPASFGPWQDDWQRAWIASEPIVANAERKTRFLERVIVQLRERMEADLCWAAIAAVADELLAHEYLEREPLSEVLGFWMRRT